MIFLIKRPAEYRILKQIFPVQQDQRTRIEREDVFIAAGKILVDKSVYYHPLRQLLAVDICALQRDIRGRPIGVKLNDIHAHHAL